MVSNISLTKRCFAFGNWPTRSIICNKIIFYSNPVDSALVCGKARGLSCPSVGNPITDKLERHVDAGGERGQARLILW